MNVRKPCLVAVVLITLFTASSGQAAKKNGQKPNSKPKPNANPVTQARNSVNDAQRHVSEASARLALARARLQHAIKQAGQVRSEVEKEHDSAPGLQAARRLLGEHRRDLGQLKQEVRDKLAADPRYQDAIAARDENKKRIASLPAGQTSEQAAAEKAFGDANARVHRLENDAFAANAKVKTASDDAQRHEADLRELVKKRDAEIQNDSRLSGAKGEIQQAKASLTVAEQVFQNAAQRLALAEQYFAQRMATQRTNASRSKRPVRSW